MRVVTDVVDRALYLMTQKKTWLCKFHKKQNPTSTHIQRWEKPLLVWRILCKEYPNELESR